MRTTVAISILCLALPVWLTCASTHAGETPQPVLEASPAPPPEPEPERVQLATADVPSPPGPDTLLPIPEVCADVPQGHPSGRVRFVCDCAEGADPDCKPGNDSAPGQANAPMRSYEAARRTFSAMHAGDTIAFCRGGSFSQRSENRWVNPRCRADRRCVVRDYVPGWASGDEAAPIISTPANGRAFGLDNRGRSEQEEGYTFMNLDLRSKNGSRGFFLYNDVDDVTICNVRMDGFDIGVHVAGSNDQSKPGSDGKNDRIVLKHSRITNSPGQGWLGSCDGCVIENSYFENNGFAKPKFNHNIYLSSSNKAVAKGMRVIGNELYRSAVLNGKCEGVSLVAHGQQDGLLIEGNLVREDIGAVGRGCWGIAVDTGYSAGESFRNVVIRNNRVINVGPVSIGLNACSGCLIENNVIVQEQALNGRHIAAPNRNRSPNDQRMDQVTIRNNSIYVGARSGGVGIRLGEEGRRHRVVSNAIYYAGKVRWACLELSRPADAYDAVGHNVCWAPQIPGFDWELSGGSLDAWRAKTSLGQGSRQADPGYASIRAPQDLSAASAKSAIVGAGDPEHSSVEDIEGKPRGDAPDAGAFQR